MSNQYENQLRRKIDDTMRQYRELGGHHAIENGRRAMPIVSSQIEAIKNTIAGKTDIPEHDLNALQAKLKVLTNRRRSLRALITPPPRAYSDTTVYVATVNTRTLDFDSSDHAAHQYGGTITSRKATIDVTDSASADRDPLDRPRREHIRSDITNETRLLQARLAWHRSRIADLLDSLSTATWAAALPFRATDSEFRSAVKG